MARALLSVSDKTGLADLAQRLNKLGVELLSTGGTAAAVRAAGVPVRDITDFTGAPEMLDGRVKTLHPRVHGGLLGRDTEAHRAQMRTAGIERIDLVVVNLYPFRETVARGGTFDEVIENIDIGGPALIRSAAKNHERVTVLVDPADYPRVLTALEEGREVPAALRFELARKAFAYTAAYDGAIANHLGRLEKPQAPAADFGENLHLHFRLSRGLRYGENPHQKAAFYGLPEVSGPSLARADVLQGKELSYNNLLDLDAAMKLCAEFSEPAVVIVKHTNPCGVAAHVERRRAGRLPPGARDRSRVGLRRHRRRQPQRRRRPGQGDGRDLPRVRHRPRLHPGGAGAVRGQEGAPAPAGRDRARAGERAGVSRVAGGLLVQTRDASTRAASLGKVVSRRPPTETELRDLDFAWRVAKHVKSNAIVFAPGRRHPGHRRRPDVAGRFGPHRGVQGPDAR